MPAEHHRGGASQAICRELRRKWSTWRKIGGRRSSSSPGTNDTVPEPCQVACRAGVAGCQQRTGLLLRNPRMADLRRVLRGRGAGVSRCRQRNQLGDGQHLVARVQAGNRTGSREFGRPSSHWPRLDSRWRQSPKYHGCPGTGQSGEGEGDQRLVEPGIPSACRWDGAGDRLAEEASPSAGRDSLGSPSTGRPYAGKHTGRMGIAAAANREESRRRLHHPVSESPGICCCAGKRIARCPAREPG